MGLPGPEADPAEVRLARLVLANHVVAAPVLLYRGTALKRDAVFRNTEKCIGGITSKLTFRPNLEHCIASQIAVMECNRIGKNPGSKLTQVKMSSLDDWHTHTLDTDRGALLGVGGDPVAGLAVVVALLDPLLDEVTPAERVGVILQSILL